MAVTSLPSDINDAVMGNPNLGGGPPAPDLTLGGMGDVGIASQDGGQGDLDKAKQAVKFKDPQGPPTTTSDLNTVLGGGPPMGQDLGPPIPPPPDLYEHVSPGFAYLSNSAANAVQTSVTNDSIWKGAMSGQTIDDQNNANDQIYQQMQAQQKAQQIHQDLANANATVDTNNIHELQQHVTDALNRTLTPPTPAPLQNPSILSGLISGLGAMIFKRQAGEIASAPFNYGLQQQATTNAQNRQNYEDQVAQQKTQIAGYNSLTDQAIRVMGDHLMQAQHNAQVDQMAMGQLNQRLTRADAITERTGLALTSAWSKLNPQSTDAQVDDLANQLGKLGGYRDSTGAYHPGPFGLSPEAIAGKKQELQARRIPEALKERDDLIKINSQDGVVDEAKATQLNSQFRDIENRYQLNPGTLGQAPTFTNLKRMNMDRLGSQFQESLAQKQVQFDDNYKLKSENYQRLLSNDTFNRDMATKRMSLAMQKDDRGNAYLAIAQYNAANKNVNDKVDNELNGPKGLNVQIEGLKAQIQADAGATDKPSQQRGKKNASELQGLEAQAAFLEQQRSPDLMLPSLDMSGQQIHTGVPNPGYIPPPGYQSPVMNGQVDPADDWTHSGGAAGPVSGGVQIQIPNINVGIGGNTGGHPITKKGAAVPPPGFVWKGH